MNEDEMRDRLSEALWRLDIPPEPPIPWPDKWADALLPVVRGLIADEREQTAELRRLAPRFWQRVSLGAPTQCWPWTGPTTPFGHGRFESLVGRLAHRCAWALANGEVPPAALLVRHTCDNPPCCNPAHLVLGTYADNNRDAVVRGRADFSDSHCRKGHPRTAANTATRRDGSRRCVVCANDAQTLRRKAPGVVYQCWECPTRLTVHSLVRHLRKVHGQVTDAMSVRARADALAAGTEPRP